MAWGPFFLRAGAIGMDFDRGGIQAHGLDADAHDLLALQLLENLIEHAALGPAIHTGVDGMPSSEAFGQSAPFAAMLGDIEQGVQQLQVVDLNIATLAGKTGGAIRWYCAWVISMQRSITQNYDLVLTRPRTGEEHRCCQRPNPT